MAGDDRGNALITTAGRDAAGKDWVFTDIHLACWGARQERDGIDGICGVSISTANTPCVWHSSSITYFPTALSVSTSVYAISPLDLFSMLWMLILRLPSVCEMRPSMSGTLALAMARR